MIIDAISDLHGHFPKLEGGDILILGGDYTARDTIQEWKDFYDWLKEQPYKHKVYIAGNHDNLLEEEALYPIIKSLSIDNLWYLKDELIEIEGIKIYGTPWTKNFEGINPHCTAFTCQTEKELGEKFNKIPKDIDIVLSHSPPMGILDIVGDSLNVGSIALGKQLLEVQPKYFFCGHIHEQAGKHVEHYGIQCHNISHVNENYEPINKVLRIEI